MKSVTFIEGQQQLFGFHDDSDIPVTTNAPDVSLLSPSVEVSQEESDLDKIIDRYVNQGLNYFEARKRAYLATSATSEAIGKAESLATSHESRQTQCTPHSRGPRRWERIDHRSLTPREKILADRQERDPNLR